MAQRARMVGKSLGPPEILQKYCQRRKKATLRKVGELRLYLKPVVPDELIFKILGPSAVKSKDSYKAVQEIRLQ
jgi:hypothetical protein